MTLRQQVGQLLMIGFAGHELSRDTRSWIREYRPGGVILFSRNLVDPQQIARLTSSLQSYADPLPLLIAIDQEGGRVSRLPNSFTIFPSAAQVAECESLNLAYQSACVTARELRAVGINMNMAPVLDINTNPQNPIIGDRAFGNTTEVVCGYAEAILTGFHDHGVVACGKHFPGHGDTSKDSHVELPVVNLDKQRIYETELQPFRHAIRHGLPAIMTAHVRYPALDPACPATLSHPILTGMLRQELGFDGLILTDDLEMQAIIDHFSIGEAAVRSLEAGADILLICHQLERQTEAVLAVEKAIQDKRLTQDRLQESVARVKRVKERYLRPSVLDQSATMSEIVGCAAHRRIAQAIVEKSTMA